MLTNDIKKGMEIKLSCGWKAIMQDNKKGNIRVAEVFGYEHETGSVYAYDIVLVKVDGFWHHVEHTPAQLKQKAMGW